jgi:multiple sugar transport system substrate-binding protein
VLADQFPAKYDWGVAPVPTYDGEFHGKPRAMLLGGFWNINQQSRYKLEAWEVVKWFARYEIRGKMLTAAKNIDLDPKVLAYVEESPQNSGFAAFAGTLDQDYLATYPHLPGWQAPEISPCTVFQCILAEGGDLEAELRKVDEIWNRQLDEYFAAHPWVDRGWNTYPEFDGRTGRLGPPQTPHTHILKPDLIDEWVAAAKGFFSSGH